MPFVDQLAESAARGGLADGLAHDIITRLAKLRSLFVIAQGTVFALDERSIGAQEAGRTLNVDYFVSGSVRRQVNRLLVNVDLVETRTARVVWAEAFDNTLDDAFLVLDEIGNRIVASIAGEIETIERNRAVLRPPNSLDAWEAHHRGLWHMYRFNRADNDRARHFFEMAVRLDPTFSRAYAGLSFTVARKSEAKLPMCSTSARKESSNPFSRSRATEIESMASGIQARISSRCSTENRRWTPPGGRTGPTA